MLKRLEAKYPISFTELGKRFVLGFHYNGSNSFLYVNSVKMHQFKAKNSEVKTYPLSLGNIAKDFTIDSIKKAGLKGSKVEKFFIPIKMLLTLTILIFINI